MKLIFEKCLRVLNRPVCWCVQLLMDQDDVFPKRVKQEAGRHEIANAVGSNGFTDAAFTSLSMILVSEVSMGAKVNIRAQILFLQDWNISGYLRLK